MRALHWLHVVRLLSVLLLLAPAAGRARAADMEPIWLGTPFLEGWVPENADVVRGVVILDGWPNDGRWAEACAYWRFAILRINTDQYGADLADDPEHAHLKKGPAGPKAFAVAYGLRRLGELTGHPELAHVPIVASGYSRFSGTAPTLMQAFPSRALCFLNGNSGGADKADPANQLVWKQTPSMGLQCEWENLFSGGDKTQLLDQWWRRPDGNLAMAGMTWRVYHNPKTFADLGILFVDQVIKARIPDDWDPRKGPAKLLPLDEKKGWMGSHDGWRVPVADILKTNNENAQIAPFDKFTGDRQRASWLVSEELAWSWRAFSSRYPQARIVAPGFANVALHQDKGAAPLGHLESGVRAGAKFTAAVAIEAPNAQKIEFFANTLPLGESTSFTGGETALGNTRNARCAITVTIAKAGIYALMARYTLTDGRTGWTRPVPLVVWNK